MKMVWDVRAKTLLREGSEYPGGSMGNIGWDRLVSELRRAGEFATNETVTHLIIDESGIKFRVETK